MAITQDYDPLFIVVSDDNQSLRGYYLHRAHLACAGLSYIILRTSKPVSRLIKASCNPLSADEILSITVFISTRCSSEMAARPTNSLRTSDRTLDGAGLFCLLSSGAGHWELRGSMGLSSGLTGLGEALRDDTSGRPRPERRSPEEVFRSPSSLEEIPRRRAHLRGAKARTAKYMRWLFS